MRNRRRGRPRSKHYLDIDPKIYEIEGHSSRNILKYVSVMTCKVHEEFKSTLRTDTRSGIYIRCKASSRSVSAPNLSRSTEDLDEETRIYDGQKMWRWGGVGGRVRGIEAWSPSLRGSNPGVMHANGSSQCEHHRCDSHALQ